MIGNLYTSKCTIEPSVMNKFLDKCNHAKISEEECKDLTSELSIIEIQKPIMYLKSEKNKTKKKHQACMGFRMNCTRNSIKFYCHTYIECKQKPS